MDLPIDVHVSDHTRAFQVFEAMTLGHYFAFIDETKVPKTGREQRLVAEPAKSHRVLPLVGGPIELPGCILAPKSRRCTPVGTIVADRDLYRAEQDTVNVFIAVPGATSGGFQLRLEASGQLLASRQLKLEQGIAVETFSTLLPGSYTASLLTVDGDAIGTSVRFTVAEYSLAPLSGELLSHDLDRNNDELRYELAVESYQMPFDEELEVALVDAGREVSSERLAADGPGRYSGKLSMQALDGPFRLRLLSTRDAERVAEVAIPGSRARERDMTVVSELGAEFLFSMMPEPKALPIRGGYLSKGDTLATPLVVEEVVSESFELHVKKDVDSLHLVLVDLTTGEATAVVHGDVRAGETLLVDSASALCTVVAGGIVSGRPFEGYTTFLRPTCLELGLSVPETLRPGTKMRVELSTKGPAGSTPVLLAVRDRRLTAADKPATGLGAATKRAISDATEGMEQGFIDSDGIIVPIVEDAPVFLEEDGGDIAIALGGEAPPPTSAVFSDGVLMIDNFDREASMGAAEPAAVEESMVMVFGEEEALDLSEEAAVVFDAPAAASLPQPTRSEFPEVLFYGVVPVDGTKEVVIDVGDSLGTFTVEAFALDGSDWTDASATVTVDKPVRIDLELPPAVHRGDEVVGRVRAATASGQARVRLTRDGEPITLRGGDGDLVSTPAELELDVAPGTYVATVEDPESGETDRVELAVGEPGRFRSHAKELGLLLAGDDVTLDSAKALTLRVLPSIQESFDCLTKATAGYDHLCCEQTAAKLLAATFIYLTTKNDGDRRRAEETVRAGIEREETMQRLGRGFAMYPDYEEIFEHYSRLTVRYLWNLRRLHEAPDVPESMKKLASAGVQLANAAGEAHGMDRKPTEARSLEDAYAMATEANEGCEKASVETFVASALDFTGDTVRLAGDHHRVAQRAGLAYAAATLVALGRFEQGIRIANQVTRQFNENGRLYSTVDSVAAIALMIELRAAGLVQGAGRLRVNGREMSASEANALAQPIESIEVLEGVAAVEITSIKEDDWNVFEFAFPVRIGFRDRDHRKVDRFRAGDRVDLVISLPKGYRAGDLAHVSLPACMSWVEGGGKVKLFSMDFEGKDELVVPIIVTSKIKGRQRFAVCVRNMFEEERVTSPGLLTVMAAS